MSDESTTIDLTTLLRTLQVFPEHLPAFDVDRAPDHPVRLFVEWLTQAVDDKVSSPHAMSLATADAAGRPSTRVLICKNVDDEGRWYFATSATSAKGRDLAANPHAALTFYWPQVGRQIRVRGPVASAGPEAGAADFLARPEGSRAEALIGRQSQPLDDPADLDEAFRRAKAAIEADPGLVSPTWTLYALTAHEVEFWQADHDRRHTRLCYRRDGQAWSRQRLWP
ncbi:pyridoxal 5'-phosphate synthase [Nonomuraea sp. NPDC047897]|uniref:pyridoxine/pyridoxamine 5'-phosphate oxidase n=1 Tax=Nonomuraea sp. NPDC047897 TaxID=3364346 RepID=UPI003715D89A